MAVHERAWYVVVPHHAHGARVARQRLATELHGLLPTGVLQDTIAVVAELVGNAVRHARPLPGGVIRVAWRLARTTGGVRVQVRVTDGGGPRLPRPRAAGPDSMDGRGLAIVSALARRWGVLPAGAGQCVWAELGAAELSRAEASSAELGTPREAAGG